MLATMLPVLWFYAKRSKKNLNGSVQPMADYQARRTMMVDTQVRPSDVTKFPIINAMLSVPREAFVPDSKREAAYVGENVDLGGDRVVLEPRTLAKLLDALDIQPDEMVLDIGCGLGYSSAVVARLAEAVVAVEEDTGHSRQRRKTVWPSMGQITPPWSKGRWPQARPSMGPTT